MRSTTIALAALCLAVLASVQVPGWVAPDHLGPKPCEQNDSCP